MSGEEKKFWWLVQFGVACGSICCWMIIVILISLIIDKKKESIYNYRKLEIKNRKEANTLLDNKYNRFYRDILGTDKVIEDVMVLLLMFILLLNGILSLILRVEVIVMTLVIGGVLGVLCVRAKNKTKRELKEEEKVKLEILRLRIKYNRYLKDLTNNTRVLLERDFENVLKTFRTESTKESDFKNTKARLKELSSRLDRFLKIETIT